jgi:hypothetical protein
MNNKEIEEKAKKLASKIRERVDMSQEDKEWIASQIEWFGYSIQPIVKSVQVADVIEKGIIDTPELLDVLQGLVSDVGNLLCDVADLDFEWQQAGYYETAKELIKKATE